MNNEKWILHVDLLSYDPNKVSQESSVNLHIVFGSQAEMNRAYIDYHANIGEHFTLSDAYTIMAVEPSLYPVYSDDDTAGGN